MTPAELTHARKALGLTAVRFARAFGITDRTVRAWENEGLPIPFVMATLVKLAVKSAMVRRELGIHEGGRAAKGSRAPHSSLGKLPNETGP